jgi:hypothetical protein
MRIDSSGNVGIGTSSPATKLTVSDGSITAGSSGDVLIGRFSSSFPNPGAGYFRIKTNNDDGNNGGISIDTLSSGSLIEQMRINRDGLFSFNSGYGSAAVAYGCRAWVNFNGSGTPAIRASGNVSSITDNGTGNFTVNFSTALTDANYSVSGMASDTGGVGNRGLVALYRGVAAPSTSSFTIFTFTDSTQTDNTYVYVSVFR